MKAVILATATVLLSCNRVRLDPGQIVMRHVEAIGGQERLDRIQSLRIVSKARLKNGSEKLFIVESQKPDSFRIETISNGKSDLMVLSGKVGFVKQSRQGEGQITKFEHENADTLRCMANFGSYVTSCIPPSRLRFSGHEKVGDRDCFKLVGRLQNLTIEYLIDSKSYYLAQMRTQADGETLRTIETFTDFFSVDGVIFPKATISEVIGLSKEPDLFSNSVELNVKFPQGHFAPLQ
jgi:hypothetical protein